MPDLVTAVGGSTSNAYVSLDEADAYLDTRLNATAWTGETSDDQKARAILEATRDLTLLEQFYEGQRMTITQALSWPRQFAINPDAPEIIGIHDIALLYYAQTIVPDRIKNATCELALEFLRAGTTDIASLDPKLQIIRKRIDVIETQYAEPWARAQGLARFPRVMAWIGPLLANSASGGLDLVRT